MRPRMRLDLGGIAKGYAVDEALLEGLNPRQREAVLHHLEQAGAEEVNDDHA